MLRIPIVFNRNLCKLTETVQQLKGYKCNKIYLVYLQDVQYVSVGDHCLD